MSRCNNPKATAYNLYGGRGIKVCDRWMESFSNFLEDMGERPQDTSLDRIDFNGNYEPSNCRWANSVVQARNKRNNLIIDYDGTTMCLEAWAEELGIKSNSILTRLKRGWSIGQALLLEPRFEKEYDGRLSEDELKALVLAVEGGMKQTTYGKAIGMDASQVSRLYRRFRDKYI